MKTPTDAIARYRRMHGDNVFLPIGFDAFGLPAENAAIKNGINPRDWTMANIEKMRRQLRTMGATLGLGRRGRHLRPRVLPLEPVAVPAVPGGRPGLPRGVAGRLVPQRRHAGPRAGRGRGPPLLALRREGREARPRRSGTCGSRTTPTSCSTSRGIDWPEPIRIMQTNWIGRSRAPRSCSRPRPSPHHAGGEELRVFTTRPDTLFGATFMVARAGAPAGRDADRARPARRRSRRTSRRPTAKTEIERLSTDREKTGVAIGADAINPVNGERIPIFVADYVLGGYGTGAIMAVPAHDERDFAFAKKFGLPIRARRDAQATPIRTRELDDGVRRARGRRGHGQLAAGSPGCPAAEGWHEIVGWLEERGQGQGGGHLPPARLADQPPALLGHADPGHPLRARTASCRCPRTELPVLLPDTVDYRGSGENPLNRDEAFLNVACPSCGGPARRETDTHGHVHRLVVVLVPLPVAAQGRRAGRRRHGRALDARSSSTRAAPSTP